MDVLRLLYDYFPTAIFTGNSVVFISEDWKVELKEHKSRNFGSSQVDIPIIRVSVSKKALNGEFVAGHYQDFQIASLGDLAQQIERYIQFAVGKNIREEV